MPLGENGSGEVKAFRAAVQKEIDRHEARQAKLEQRKGRKRKRPGWGTTLLGAFSEATNPYHHDMPWKYKQR